MLLCFLLISFGIHCLPLISPPRGGAARAGGGEGSRGGGAAHAGRRPPVLVEVVTESSLLNEIPYELCVEVVSSIDFILLYSILDVEYILIIC